MSTYDLHIFQGLNQVGSSKLEMAFGTGGGAAVTGVQKAVQRFTVVFLTEQGSVLRSPLRGTNFLRQMRVGLMRTRGDVLQYFNIAAVDVITQLQDLAAPADEQVVEATLDDFTLAPPELTLWVTITTAAGETRQVIMPVNDIGVRA